MTHEWQETSSEKVVEQKQNPFTGTLLASCSTYSFSIIWFIPYRTRLNHPAPLHVLNPAKHLFYNLNRYHSRRIRRQGSHTEQIRSPLVLPNERRNQDRLSIGRGLLSFLFPALPAPLLLLQDSFRALTRRSSDMSYLLSVRVYRRTFLQEYKKWVVAR